MDHIYLLWLQQFREITDGVFDSFFLGISELGERTVPLVVLSGIFWCLHKKAGRTILLGFTCAYWTMILTKITACVYRPFMTDSRLHPLSNPNNYSFPSGHAYYATAYLGGIALWQWNSKALRNTCLLLLALILFSRNYIGVHTPQDVLCGSLFAFVIMGFVWKLAVYEESHPGFDKWILLLGLLLSGALAWFAVTKNYPLQTNEAGKLLINPATAIKSALRMAGWGIGFFIGWFIEKRWIQFSVEGTWQQRCVRFILGTLGLWLVMKTLASCIRYFLPGTTGLLLSNALPALYIMCVVPLCIKYAEEYRK